MTLDAKNLDKVKELIALFRSRNVKVVFFRMPVNPTLVEAEKFVVTARELKTRFPEISMLPQPNDEKYETEDGVHLTYRAALWFTEDFNRWVGDLFGRDEKPRS